MKTYTITAQQITDLVGKLYNEQGASTADVRELLKSLGLPDEDIEEYL